MSSNPSATPTSTGRILALDVLRGIAIIGTLATNIWIFAKAGLPIPAPDDTERSRSFLDAASYLVTDGKWIGLLTIMFGIGLEIQRQSAIRKGEKWPGRYPWRAGLLILDGLINYIFIFQFDVLMGYGLTALAVCAIMATSPKVQKIWMVTWLVLHVAVIGTLWFFLINGAFEEEIAAEDSQLPPIDSYWAGVTYRLENFLTGRLEIPIMFVMGMGLFLVGAHLYRAGIFLPEGARLRTWVMRFSFGVALPIDAALRLYQDGIYAGPLVRYVTSTLVAFGVLAAVAHYYDKRGRLGAVGSFFTTIGRTALSCYVLQNLLASLVFYGWGLGLATTLEERWLELAALIAWAVLSLALYAFATLWLKVFTRGPLEALWHWSFEAIGTTLDKRQAKKRKHAENKEPVLIK